MPPPASTARPRVFVSSVIEGYGEFRQAARLAIEQAGGEPVMVNEDFPSASISSRNACLDGVDSSDIFLLLIGARGGWRTPSGRLVVEEELDQARSRRLPVLVFLQNIEQDTDAKRLADTVTDYVDGFFRVRFEDTVELRQKIPPALQSLIQTWKRPAMNPNRLATHLQQPYKIADQASLRFVLVPEREEEIIDPIRLASKDFEERIFEIGHSKSVGLFSYQRAKEPPRMCADSLIIDQTAGSDWREGLQGVRLTVAESGLIIVDSNISGRTERSGTDVIGVMVIAIEDVEALLNTDFQFANALYQDIDPYKRHHRSFWNAAVTGLGYRTFMRNPQQQRASTVTLPGGEEPGIAFSEPRLIDRSTLVQPMKEIERAVHIWTQRRSGLRRSGLR
jgi:Domain of unknown function (DUF4062)